MKILIAEDDTKAAEYLLKGLVAEGHAVDHVVDGREALSYALYSNYDVMIFDRMMPGMNGLDVLKALRAAGNNTPVIFLTAMADVDDRVEGLNAGSNDYLTKPFHFSELIARISAVTRQPAESEPVTHLQVHDLTLDLLTRTARRNGKTIELQAKEYGVLELLMRNAGRIVTKAMLLERVWDYSFDPGTTVVETHISRLRAKIDKPFDAPLLHTSRNMGYMIRAPY